MNTICIIEDNLPISKLFSILMQKAGFDTVQFQDGKSALEWMRENEPVGVILDILLPDMNGGDLLNILKEDDKLGKIPVIAVTGFAYPNDEDKFMSMGFQGYFAKPINTATFADDIKNFFV